MGSKENPAAPPQPPPKRPLGKRKALAELPINAPNAGDGGSAPRATKPRTRAEAEARKRREAEGVTRLPDPKRPDAGAAQAAVAPYIEAIDEYLRSLEVRVS
jgi:cyclin-A